ncbi:MAG TPA: hypothetical protein VMU84_17415 [Thermoanaerobaculia bacterium]|nr:hypothetical protein [Thermoanaerobaculia bacterium]
MRRRTEWRAAILLLIIACKPVAPSKPAARVATIRATVITIRTTLEPSKKTYTHEIVIVGNRARSTGENDTWRVFDVAHDRVTFVDDIAKTFRVEPLASIVKKRREAMRAPIAEHIPRATFAATTDVRTIQGVQAKRYVVSVGKYERQLWIGEHKLIPKNLFAMMQASDPPSTPLAPMMREADDALTAIRGFPLLEHAEVPYGNAKMVLDRAVIAIAQRDMPRALLDVPRGYREIQ